MTEIASHTYEVEDHQEGIKEQNIPSFNDVENNIKQNYETNSILKGADTIALKQYKEHQQLKEQKENPILQEAREGLDKEAMINEAKTMLYEKLGIDENQNNNSSFENFEKGIVDELVLNNYDLAIQIWETNGKIILDGLSQLASWEGLKQIAEAIGESFMSLFTGNAYEKGKAVAELGLIGTGVGTGVYVGKKTVKLGMKQIYKLRVNKERLVNSPDVKQIVGETNNKVAEIVPKKQLDFEKAVVEDIAKLGDKDRIDAGKFYLQKDIIPNQQEAIIKAHNVGLDRDGAGIYNYNQGEILEKSRILKDAGFNKTERKILLEKGVYGKEVVNKNLVIKEFQNREKVKDIASQIDKLENMGVPKEYSKLLLESGFYEGNLLKRYERLQNTNKIDFQGHIMEFIDTNKHLNLKIEEAYVLFGYTDFLFYSNMNNAIRSGKKLTKAEYNFISLLESGLNKLPNIKGKLKTQFRGDNWIEWTKISKKQEGRFKGFTSTSNPSTSPYWEESLVQMTIDTKTAKDLTGISLITKFGNKLKGKDGKIIGRTEQESVLLQNVGFRVEKAPYIYNIPNIKNTNFKEKIINNGILDYKYTFKPKWKIEIKEL